MSQTGKVSWHINNNWIDYTEDVSTFPTFPPATSGELCYRKCRPPSYDIEVWLAPAVQVVQSTSQVDEQNQKPDPRQNNLNYVSRAYFIWKQFHELMRSKITISSSYIALARRPVAEHSAS